MDCQQCLSSVCAKAPRRPKNVFIYSINPRLLLTWLQFAWDWSLGVFWTIKNAVRFYRERWTPHFGFHHNFSAYFVFKSNLLTRDFEYKTPTFPIRHWSLWNSPNLFSVYHLHGNSRFYAYFGETQTIQVGAVLAFLLHILSFDLVHFFLVLLIVTKIPFRRRRRHRIQILCIYSQKNKTPKRETSEEKKLQISKANKRRHRVLLSEIFSADQI